MSARLNELRNIEKPLILLLRGSKVDQAQIAKVMGISQQAISNVLNSKVGKHAQQE